MAPNEKAAWWRPEFNSENPNESGSSDDIKWGLGILFALGFPVVVVLLVIALVVSAFLH